MKKFLVIVLAMMVFAGTAYAQTDKEILFRDTPWGISFEEAQRRFPELYLVDMTMGFSFWDSVLSEVPFYNDYQNEYNGEYLGISADSFGEADNLNVGGYNAESVFMRFAYDTKDGLIDRTKSKLYSAAYLLEVQHINEAVSSFAKKLDSLYGEPKISAPDKYYTWNVWFGANNTGVYMKSENEPRNDGYYRIWISYFTLDGNTWLEAASKCEAERIRQDEMNSADSNDTSGL